MVWKLRVGSTVTVTSAGGLRLNATGTCPVSFCWPSAVVIQTFTCGDEGSPPPPPPALAAGDPRTPSSRAAELTAATPTPSEDLFQILIFLPGWTAVPLLVPPLVASEPPPDPGVQVNVATALGGSV